VNAVLTVRSISFAVLVAAAATLRAQTVGSVAPDFSIKTLASGDNFFFGDIAWLK
jgi:hypothetical protein